MMRLQIMLSEWDTIILSEITLPVFQDLIPVLNHAI